jgi:hypothetical protein
LETRRAAVSAIKEFCKHHSDSMTQHAAKIAATLCPILSSNDSNIRVRLISPPRLSHNVLFF